MPKEAFINKPAEQPIVMKAGTTITGFTIRCKSKATGTPIDWTGWTFTCTVKESKSKSSKLLATIDVTGDTEGNLVFNSTAIAEVAAGEHTWLLRGVNGSQTRDFFDGAWIIKS